MSATTKNFEQGKDEVARLWLPSLSTSRNWECTIAPAKGEGQHGAINRQIEAMDAEIDRLVYDLYGLTKEEIAIVEGQQ
jgi:hypothetical protein